MKASVLEGIPSPGAGRELWATKLFTRPGYSGPMRRGGPIVAVLALAMIVPFVPSGLAGPQPGLFCDQGEAVHDRLFPEPEVVTDFISWDEALCGLDRLDERHGDLIEIKEVGQSVGWMNHQTGEHDTFPVLAVEVTDETVQDKRGALVFLNSIHGNEKGAREGALRIIEDLLTGQGMAEDVRDATGHDVSEVLQELRLVFTFPNPDGWTHEMPEYRANDACFVSATCPAVNEPGELGLETQNFVRVNGNGTDLNRQYPTTGTPHPSWPAMTEPEIAGQVDYLKNLPEPVLAGVDLHGMINAENLTYLMIKDTQRDLAEVPHHEAVARITAQYLHASPELEPWRRSVGPATVWGSTYDLLGYSAPGTGGAFIVQDAGLNAPGFTVELAYNHIAFDNYYQGPGQAMNVFHVAAMRDIALGFLDYAYNNPGGVAIEGESAIGVLAHPEVVPEGRHDGTDADPMAFFTDEITRYGADVTRLGSLTPDALEGLTHIVVPDTALTANLDAFGATSTEAALSALQAWTEAGGTLVLTDRAVEHAIELGLASGSQEVQDVTGKVDRVTLHGLTEGTNPPVESLVDGNPLRYDAGTVPSQCLDGFTGTSVGELVLADGACTVIGEAQLGQGTVRVMGVALPPPVDVGDHGVDGYALTPNGARILLNTVGLSIVDGLDLAGDEELESASNEGNDTPGVAPALVLAAIAAIALAAGRRRGV